MKPVTKLLEKSVGGKRLIQTKLFFSKCMKVQRIEEEINGPASPDQEAANCKRPPSEITNNSGSARDGIASRNQVKRLKNKYSNLEKPLSSSNPTVNLLLEENQKQENGNEMNTDIDEEYFESSNIQEIMSSAEGDKNKNLRATVKMGSGPKNCHTETSVRSWLGIRNSINKPKTKTKNSGGGFRGPYTCNFPSCSKVFSQSQAIRYHIIRSHLKKGKTKPKCICNLCKNDKLFASITSLNTHFKQHWDKKPYPCSVDVCGKSFVTLRALKKHGISHSQNRPFVCEFCALAFKAEKDLTVHKMNSAKLNLECTEDECGKRFCHKVKYTAHKLEHEKTQMRNVAKSVTIPEEDFVYYSLDPNKLPGFSCGFCTTWFKSPSDLNQHVRTHTNEEPFSCDICQKTFKQKSNLKTHQKVHQVPNNEFQCSKCYIKMKNAIGLERHVIFCGNEAQYYTTTKIPFSQEELKARPTAKKKTHIIYACKQCEKKARDRKEYMEDHVLRHHIKIKLYSCHFCDKRFTHRTELQTHSRSHTLEEPFVCKICGKGFKQSTHYKAHMVSVHSNERTFECTLCPATFKTKACRDGHIKSLHLKERPYTCEIQGCGKAFNRSGVLSRHKQKEHTNYRPFKCEEEKCGKVFISRTELKLHNVHVHKNERPFPCTICKRSFKLNGKLLEHKRTRKHLDNVLKAAKKLK